MKILDMSAGNRGVWFDKNHPDVMYVDVRSEVNPTIVADTRALPVSVGSGFDLVVFDPPHEKFFGANSNMSRDYGHHTAADIRDTVAKSAREAHRVTKPGALMAFKWNDHGQSFKKILGLMSPWWEPLSLSGHQTAVRTKHSSQTQWVLLRRRDETLSLVLAAE